MRLLCILPLLASLVFVSPIYSQDTSGKKPTKELTSPNVYFLARALSGKTIVFISEVSLLQPPHSVRHSFGKHISFHMSYKKNVQSKAMPVSLLWGGFVTFDSKWKYHSLSIAPGLRFPNTNRKSDLFFGLNIGATFSTKKSHLITPYFELAGHLKVKALSRTISALVGVSARYELFSEKWWNNPQSINLLAGLDFGI